MPFIDSHCHLDDEKFDLDRTEVIQQIKKDDFSFVITAGYSLEGSRKAIELAKQYNFIYATCGISPNDLPQTEEELWKDLEQIKEMVNCNAKIIAIGEIGLDYYWNIENKELQKKAFQNQISLANELDLPIVIHTREAVMDTIHILKEKEVKRKGVFHCCPQNPELIKEALKLGFYISFAGPITFKNSKRAKEIVELVPIDRLLLETDSPYLSPEPKRGMRNDPTHVKYIAEKVAELREMHLEELTEQVLNNAKKIFGI